MSTSSKHNAICVFCYKSAAGTFSIPQDEHTDITTYETEVTVRRFLKLLERFLHEEGKTECFNKFKFSNIPLVCCGDCVDTLDTFCTAYHQLICIKLQLEWKLQRLVAIMKLAGRVPSRVIKPQEMFHKMFSTGSHSKGRAEETWEDVLTNFKRFRQRIIKRCTQHLSRSQPRVLINRNVGDGHSDRQTLSRSIDTLYATPVKVEQDSEAPHEDTIFLEWAMSFLAVIFLLSFNSQEIFLLKTGDASLNSIGSFTGDNEQIKLEFVDDLPEEHMTLSIRNDVAGLEYHEHTSAAIEINQNKDIDKTSQLSPVFPIGGNYISTCHGFDYLLSHNRTGQSSSTTDSIPFDETHIIEHRSGSRFKSVECDSIPIQGECDLTQTADVAVEELNMASDLTHGKFDITIDRCTEVLAPLQPHDDLLENEKRLCVNMKGGVEEENDEVILDDITNQDSDMPFSECMESSNIVATSLLRNDEVDATQTSDLRTREQEVVSIGVPPVNAESKHKCSECGKCFKTKSGSELHTNLHKDPDTWKFKCSVCGIRFYSQQNFFRRTDTHARGATLNCGLCSNQFTSTRDLLLHIKVCHNTGKTIRIRGSPGFSCSKCDRKFIGKTSLRQHVMRVHSAGTVFRSRKQMMRHTVIHADPSTWEFPCSECGERFHAKRNLETHMLEHSTLKLPIADGRVSPANNDLDSEQIITRMSPLGKSSLILRETATEQYRCPRCELVCDTKSNLKLHIVAAHMKVAPERNCIVM